MTVGNYLTYLEIEKGVSKHTLIAYNTDLHQFEEFILTDAGSFVLQNLDYTDVRRWILSLMTKKISPSSVARKISSLNSYFNYCLRHDTIKSNPTTGVILPKKGKRLPSFLKKEELNALFSAENSADDYPSLRDDLILEMLAGLGLRRSELVGLSDQNIDFGNKIIKVIGKRNKARIIPIYPKMLDKIKIYINMREATFPNSEKTFFLTNRGKPIYDKFVYLLTKQRIGEVSTIEKKSPHTLRHTYATLMLNEGAELEVIRELLGHSSLAATQIYTHSSFEELKKAYSKAHPRMKKN